VADTKPKTLEEAVDELDQMDDMECAAPKTSDEALDQSFDNIILGKLEDVRKALLNFAKKIHKAQ
jgi:hypothetical protein